MSRLRDERPEALPPESAADLNAIVWICQGQPSGQSKSYHTAPDCHLLGANCRRRLSVVEPIYGRLCKECSGKRERGGGKGTNLRSILFHADAEEVLGDD